MNIGIVGLGLIGGCLGLDFKAAGHQVYGVARRPQTCEQALVMQAVDVASTDLGDLLSCDVVFICTPIATVLPVVRQLAQVLSPQTVVTDVGSVKGALVAEATQMWPRFVGGHPMSGKSEAGIDAAQRDLFQGNPYVITPVSTPLIAPGKAEKSPINHAQTDLAAIALLEKLIAQLGSVLYHCTPTDHDRAVAWISHLPVMVSSNLIKSAMNEPNETVQQLAKALASSGFRDTSRVGGGNPELGLMMAKYNREEILRSLKRYQQEIATTIEQLEDEDWAAIAQKLESTKQARPLFLKAES
ncbi:MAG: prephenate/arogenate dehydrogenase [Cyanobacteria bacterium J06621_11]